VEVLGAGVGRLDTRDGVESEWEGRADWRRLRGRDVGGYPVKENIPMSPIKNQVHTRFKVFVGELATDRSIGDLAAKVATFAKTAGVAAKSIGVEYLESLKKVVITLGYRTDETPYPIRLHSVALGKVPVLTNDFSVLETAMAAAAEKLSNVICHELYVTEDQDFFLVLMTHEA